MVVQDEAMDDFMTSVQQSENDPVQEPMDKDNTPSSQGSHRMTVTPRSLVELGYPSWPGCPLKCSVLNWFRSQRCTLQMVDNLDNRYNANVCLI